MAMHGAATSRLRAIFIAAAACLSGFPISVAPIGPHPQFNHRRAPRQLQGVQALQAEHVGRTLSGRQREAATQRGRVQRALPQGRKRSCMATVPRLLVSRTSASL